MRRHYRMLAKMNKKASPRRLFVPKSEAGKITKCELQFQLQNNNSLYSYLLYFGQYSNSDMKYCPTLECLYFAKITLMLDMKYFAILFTLLPMKSNYSARLAFSCKYFKR